MLLKTEKIKFTDRRLHEDTVTDLRHPDALVNDLAASLGGMNSCGYGTTGQFLLAAPAAKAEFLKKVKTIVLALDEKKGNRRATATELKGDSLISIGGARTLPAPASLSAIMATPA